MASAVTGPKFTRRMRWTAAGLLLATASVWTVWAMTYTATAQKFDYEIVQTYPHDHRAYCQGLVYSDGVLFEGTGKYGESSLRRVALDTGQVLQKVDLNRRYFGEGIAVLGNRIYQLTWRERIAFVYDKQTLRPTGESFRYQGEGWGLTTDGESLIMSDGTSVLRFLDPKTFQVTRRIAVTDGRRRIANLNELEYIRGEIYANVWKEDFIVRIHPRTGAVTGIIDLSGLRDRSTFWTGEEVLNGIAYDPQGDRLFVTGKNWSKLYEIRLVEAP